MQISCRFLTTGPPHKSSKPLLLWVCFTRVCLVGSLKLVLIHIIDLHGLLPQPSPLWDFPHSRSQQSFLSVLGSENWMCLGIFPLTQDMLLCHSVQWGLPSEQSSQKEREKNNQYPLAFLRPQGLPFPVPLAREMGYFLGV